MVNPPFPAMRRRARELLAAAQREFQHDADASALLLFYAAECALKAVYMSTNNLKDAGEARGQVVSARSHNHNLLSLMSALNISRSSVPAPPAMLLQRTGLAIDVSALHQAWRYGERVVDTSDICVWLKKIANWCETRI